MDSFYHKVLTNFYRKYNEEKLSEIDGLLQKYKDSEKELIISLFIKYGGNPFEFDFFKSYYEDRFQELLVSFYNKMNPSMVGQVSSLIEKYGKNKEELIRQLCTKYDVKPYALLEFIDFNNFFLEVVDNSQQGNNLKDSGNQQNILSADIPVKDAMSRKKLYIIIGVVLFFGLGLGGFLGFKLYNKNRIERIKEIREKAIADSLRISDSLSMVQAEKQRIIDSLSTAEIERKAFEASCAGEEEPGWEFDTETDLSNGTTSESTNNWIVILGSYRTQSEAVTIQKEFWKTYKIQTEILNTNHYQNLTKDLFLVVNGKNLTKEEATQTLKDIKAKGIDGYIKNAGTQNP